MLDDLLAVAGVVDGQHLVDRGRHDAPPVLGEVLGMPVAEVRVVLLDTDRVERPHVLREPLHRAETVVDVMDLVDREHEVTLVMQDSAPGWLSCHDGLNATPAPSTATLAVRGTTECRAITTPRLHITTHIAARTGASLRPLTPRFDSWLDVVACDIVRPHQQSCEPSKRVAMACGELVNVGLFVG